MRLYICRIIYIVVVDISVALNIAQTAYKVNNEHHSLRIRSSLTMCTANLQAAQSCTHVVFSQWIDGRWNEEFQFIIV